MIYVFDTSSFSHMKPLLPDVFPAFWARLDFAVASEEVTSTREVLHELNNGEDNHVLEWCNNKKSIFAMPSSAETFFLSQIFSIRHFQNLVSEKALLRGSPVADPFVIARAHVLKGAVVTEETPRSNKPNIPAVCEHFGIPCMKLGDFMRKMGWTF